MHATEIFSNAKTFKIPLFNFLYCLEILENPYATLNYISNTRISETERNSTI